LTDAKWLHGDGSYTAILGVVKEGVPDPKEGSMPMPPMGGSRLTPDQLRAVAAYIYSLSHPEVRSHP
jgi:mono/diheme cytochrome c family protein